jgi:Mce-associated membrane protein
MSTQNPNPGPPSRRRRIAGERKGARPSAEQPAARPTEPASSAEPVGAPATEPRRDHVPSPPPPVPGPEHTDDAGPDGPAGSARSVSTKVLAALAVAAVVLVAFAASGFGLDGVGVQALQDVREQSETDSAERAAPAAAERAAAAILSYSHESLETDRDTAARFMTEDYRTEYLDTFGLVLENAPKVKAEVEAEIKASGVVHADADRANVLLFVNQTTTSTANQGEPQLALNRVMLTMEEQDGTWLVDDITSY